MKLGKAIKIARTRASYKQAELAEKLGVSSNYISLLENDKRDPSWSFVCRLSDTLRIPLPLLLLLASEEDMHDAPRTRVTRELLGLIAGLSGDDAEPRNQLP